MKKLLFMMLASVLVAGVMFGQPARTDVIWARTTTQTMTVDGRLNEPAWASAESVKIQYGNPAMLPIPGSGWFFENGRRDVVDSMKATIKFLVKGDSLYVGVRIQDRSIGGGPFNKFDGILSNIRQKQQTARPVGAGEIFYGWVKEPWADTLADQPGRMPAYLGFWGSSPYAPRPDSLNQRYWAAATTVQGVQNSDAGNDTSYVMEFKINLRTFGYDVSGTNGDIVMYSLSIYDADWQWPLDTTRQSGTRAWLQCPWGNAAAYNHMRVYGRPSVGLTDPLPAVGPEGIIPGAGTFASPVIDGRLTEAVWYTPNIGLLGIQFGNTALRNSYPSTAPYRSGQFQPSVNGGTAPVVEPSLATFKHFYKNDTLFIGVDVNDQFVQAFPSSNPDRWDGFRVVICQRDAFNPDNVLFPRILTARIGGSGTNVQTVREDDLAPNPGAWDSAGTKVQVAIALKGGTTIDTVGASPDSGWTAEMKINLRALGYPAGRGDGVLFVGAMLYDGDSFGAAASSSYGTRTWFMREGGFNDGALWAYMHPSITVSVDEQPTTVPAQFALLGNYPNPFNPSTTIKFSLPQMSDVTLEVFNILGQRVAVQNLGVQQPGVHEVRFDASQLASGVYNYRLRMGATNATVAGKMMLLK
jgi:hypothetical protein